MSSLPNLPVFSNTLPAYGGSYQVGTIDVEVPAPLQSFGTAVLKSNGQPALQLETLLFTLFYPAGNQGSGKHLDWLQRPLSTTTGGYARFLGRPKWLLLPAFWLLAGSTSLPGWMDASLADKVSGGKEVEEGTPVMSERMQKGTSGSENTLVEREDQFPLVVFSHGLGGGRTTYSQYCGELASRGYIVAAIEHRDGSGPISIVRKEDGERVVDYLKVDDLTFEPPHPTLTQLEFRKEQLLMRLAEISSVLDVLKRVNDGEGAAVSRENRRASSTGAADLSSWTGRIDLKREVTMAGHSFGGATTLQVLRRGSAFLFFRGITLDPWVDPIPLIDNTSAPLDPSASFSNGQGTDIAVPLLVINSEAFTLWTPHYQSVRDIVKGVKNDAQAWLVTLVGSIHLSFSDFPLIQPFLSRRSGARVDAHTAMNSFVEASLEFLSGAGTAGEILGERVVEGDEEGTREGEGYKKRGGVPMERVGEMRMHVRPE